MHLEASLIRLRWGHRIREARLYAGHSQEALAAELGIPQQMVSSWETGRYMPAPELWHRIADVLGVEWPTLFDPEPRQGEVTA